MAGTDPVVRSERTVERSEELLKRGLESIPNATQTNAKSASGNIRGVSPVYIERGEGSRCWDVDGNEYVDYSIACSSNVLGYNYPRVRDAVLAQLEDGKSFSKPHPLEIEVAERVIDMVPAAELVRFGKNGSDVNLAAERLARVYTDRDIVGYWGYHGWSYNQSAGRPDPVDDYKVGIGYNDLESVESLFAEHEDDVAAIHVSPYESVKPEDDYLQGLRDICDREDALLIFDEVKTGFRFAKGGAQEYFGVTPDLAAIGKAMANGYPLSALVGREDVMRLIEDEFTFTLTYGGETISLAAAREVLDIYAEEPVQNHLFELGGRLQDGFNDLASDHGFGDRIESTGFEVLSRTSFRDEHGDWDGPGATLFKQECTERGLLTTGGGTPTYSHTDDDVAFTLDVFDDAFGVLAEAKAAGDVEDRVKGERIGNPVRL